MLEYQKTLLLSDKRFREAVAKCWGRDFCAEVVRAARGMDRLVRELHRAEMHSQALIVSACLGMMDDPAWAGEKR